MTARRCSPGAPYALTLAALMVLAAPAAADWVHARTAQIRGPSTVEPPLADGPVNPVPAPGPTAVQDPPVPTVALRVRVPATVGDGEEITYRITVHNTSKATAYHVRVRDTLPINTRFVRATPEPREKEPDLLWQFDKLESCEQHEIVLVLQPNGPGEVRNCARVQFEHGECVTTRIGKAAPPTPALPAGRGELKLEKRGPTDGMLHDLLPYELIVTNAGGTPIEAVEIKDDLDEGLIHEGGKRIRWWESVGTLAPGESKQLKYFVRAQAVGEFRNRAIAFGISAGNRVQSVEAVKSVRITEPMLQLRMTGPQGDRNYLLVSTPYQITLSNPGTAAATHVELRDHLPPHTRLVSFSAGGVQERDDVVWNFGTLPPGASRTVQMVLQVLEAGEVRNQAGATADRDVKTTAENLANFVEFKTPGGVHLSVVDEGGNTLEAGKQTRYRIEVLNQGNAPLKNVRLVATLPRQLREVESKPPGRREENKLVFDGITVEAGPQRLVSFEVTVVAQQAGEARFVVEMSMEGLPPVRKEVRTTIFEPSPPPIPPG